MPFWKSVASVAALLLATAAVHAEGTFRAGTAQVEITPTKPMPMWGYGARHSLLATGTRDPLFAKAVVLEAGNAKLALVGLDLGRSLGEPHFSRIQAAVKQTSGVDFLLLVGSHTHHGPVLELKDVAGQGKGRFDDAVAYVGQLERKLIDVINEAAGKMQSARLGWQSTPVGLNRNRHAKREPKPRDPELAVVRIDDDAGKPLVILVNFAAHPTMLDGSDLRWSADYPGAMMRTVETALGARCIFLQGAAGDMSVQSRGQDDLPRDDPRLANAALDAAQAALLKSVLNLRDDEVQQRQRNMIASAFRLESFGQHLGEEVLRLAGTCMTTAPARPSIQGKYDAFDFESRMNFRNPAVRLMFGLAFFPELAAAAAAEVADNRVRPLLSTVLVNDELAFVGGSGEFFCDHALRLKERAYSTKTLLVGYCNGHHMYFPTIEAASQGGYGADPQVSWVELGAGERMMNQALIHIFSWQGKFSQGPLAP